MKKSKKVFVTTVLAAAMLTGLASCGSEKVSNDIPTINWYLRYDNQDDQSAVLDEVNKIAEKEIGARVNIKRFETGDYNEKIKLAFSAGETVDICHMAPRYGFYSHVSKGAFAPLDELIEKYAQETYKDMPESFWDATKIDGKIYGIPNYQIVGRMNGFVAQKSLLDKYNFDLQSVNKLEDIEPFFEAVKKGENPNMKVFGSQGGYDWGMNHYIGFETVGEAKYPCAIRSSDDSLTVINQFETDEFMNYCKLMRDWYQKGYLPLQGAADSMVDLKQQGLVAVWLDNIAPGYMPSFEKQLGGRAAAGKVIDPPFVNTENIIATMNCVGATSKNPDKAVQFINLVDQDKDGIYNLLCYGIEGVHYNKISETRIEKIEDSGYDPNSAWLFGNSFNAYLYGDQEDNVWEETRAANEGAVVSNILGFSLNTEPIKTELASCNAVVTEYLGSLTTGAVDPEAVMPEFLSKLKTADVDKIIAEAQKQVDEWKAVK